MTILIWFLQSYLREGLRSVSGEHSYHHSVHNLELCLIEGSNLDEDIGGVHRDLRVVTVDDRRKRTNGALRVVDDRVNRGVANDVQVFAQLLMFLFNG